MVRGGHESKFFDSRESSRTRKLTRDSRVTSRVESEIIEIKINNKNGISAIVDAMNWVES